MPLQLLMHIGSGSQPTEESGHLLSSIWHYDESIPVL